MAVLCGPTTYVSGELVATTTLDGPWNGTRADEGLRAVRPGEGYARAEPTPSSPPQVLFRFVVPGYCQGDSERAVQECNAAKQEQHAQRAETALAAFENATGWTRTSTPLWSPGGLGHGDC